MDIILCQDESPKLISIKTESGLRVSIKLPLQVCRPRLYQRWLYQRQPTVTGHIDEVTYLDGILVSLTPNKSAQISCWQAVSTTKRNSNLGYGRLFCRCRLLSRRRTRLNEWWRSMALRLSSFRLGSEAALTSAAAARASAAETRASSCAWERGEWWTRFESALTKFNFKNQCYFFPLWNRPTFVPT